MLIAVTCTQLVLQGTVALAQIQGPLEHGADQSITDEPSGIVEGHSFAPGPWLLRLRAAGQHFWDGSGAGVGVVPSVALGGAAIVVLGLSRLCGGGLVDVEVGVPVASEGAEGLDGEHPGRQQSFIDSWCAADSMWRSTGLDNSHESGQTSRTPCQNVQAKLGDYITPSNDGCIGPHSVK